MKLAVAGDSAGKGMAHELAVYLADRYDVTEASETPEGAEKFYADMADRVASGVADGTFDKAILVCGTGIGVCISANKVPGIRAAHLHDCYSAERAALSNNAQVVTLGARALGLELAKKIVDTFLVETFDEAGRSAGNVDAINMVDAKYNKA